MSQRTQVVNLYKNFLLLSRDWPQGERVFRQRLHAAFSRNKDVTDPHRIAALIAHAQYVVKEIEALYMLKKYRTLKKRYYPEN